MKIGLFYATTTGVTAAIAQRIAEALHREAKTRGHTTLSIEVLDIADYFVESMEEFDALVLGVPTWNVGQLPRGWEQVLNEFDDLTLTGRQAALFGIGDQRGYPDTFADALLFLADKLRAAGATLVGQWPLANYTFSRSWAVEDGRFLGLVIDEINQPELTAERIAAWVAELVTAFSTPSPSGPVGDVN